MKDFQQLMQSHSPFFVIFITTILFAVVIIMAFRKMGEHSSRVQKLEDKDLEGAINSANKKITELSNKITAQQEETSKVRNLFIEYLETRIKVTKQNQEKHGEQSAEITIDNGNSSSNLDNH